MRTEFQVHMLNEEGIYAAKRLAHIFESTLNLIEELTGLDGREIAIVRTKMEEACFFAKKCIANNTKYQKVD